MEGEILAVVEVIPLERVFERTEEQIDDLTVQQVVRRFSHWTRSFFRSDRIPEHIVAQSFYLHPATSRETHS